MRPYSSIFVFLFSTLCTSISIAHSSSVELADVPKLQPNPIITTEAEIAEIKRLIADLALIESPDYGYATDSRHAFPPIGEMGSYGNQLAPNDKLKRSQALKRLVELGPKSLPYLLDSLVDTTPTKLEVKCKSCSGPVLHIRDLAINSANQHEQQVAAVSQSDFVSLGVSESYTLKVGDICFVAIGQIVGRDYDIVKNLPSSCILINSPTKDETLRQAVLDLWKSDDPARTLFDSLLIDYSTRGILSGKLTDGWGVADHLQRSGALRLLYYFPEESASMIAARLDGLVVDAPDDLSGSMKQCIANQICATGLVATVAWSDDSRIKAAVLGIFERTSDPDVMCAAIRSVGPDHPELLRARLGETIGKIPQSKSSAPFGLEYKMLVGLGNYGGDDARPIFNEFVKTDSMDRRRSLIHALRTTRPEWAVELIGGFLDDRRDSGWSYLNPSDLSEPQLPIRICDEAAETLAGVNGIQFTISNTYEDRDVQISRVKDELGLK